MLVSCSLPSEVWISSVFGKEKRGEEGKTEPHPQEWGCRNCLLPRVSSIIVSVSPGVLSKWEELSGLQGDWWKFSNISRFCFLWNTVLFFLPSSSSAVSTWYLITTSQCNWIVIFVDYLYRLSGGGEKEDVPICQHYSWIREILCMNHGNSNDTALPPRWISIPSLRE